jgi:hypothetical protein
MGGSVMASIINATTTGLIVTPDNSGQLTLSANGVTALTANTTGYLNFAKQPQIGGVEWPSFMAYTLTQQTISNNSATKITLDTEEWDTANRFDTSLSRFTPNVAGYYSFTVQVRFDSTLTYTNLWTAIYKNGTNTYRGLEISNSPGATYFTQQQNATYLVYLNGSTDYVEFYIYQANGTSSNASIGYTQSPFCNRAYGFLVRAA